MVVFLKEAKMYFGKKHEGRVKKKFRNSVAKIRNQNLETSSKKKKVPQFGRLYDILLYFFLAKS